MLIDELLYDQKYYPKKLQPLYFGAPDKRYFALVFNPVARKASMGVMICRPLGQEDIRTNKAVIQLGREIASQGIVAMVFDYYGTGDAAGEFEEVTVDSCRESIRDAAVRFRQQCFVDDVVVLAIRGSALFLKDVLPTIAPRATILWHPVLNGHKYISEISKQHRTWLLGSFVRHDGIFEKKKEILGFLYSEQFRKELSSLKLDPAVLSVISSCVVITDLAQEAKAFTRMSTAKLLQSHYNNFWTKNGLDDTFVPMHDIKLIASQLMDIVESVPKINQR